MTIPLVDLKKQYQSIRKEIDEAIATVIHKTNFIMGEEVKQLEEAFSKFTKSSHTIALSSGTDAIHLALKALGVSKGDEVIVPSHTFTATAEPIIWLGATPVFVDIDPATSTIDPDEVAKAITKKTKAIIPVHLYGHPADMDGLLETAKESQLPVIEDCAQSHGALYKGNEVGNFGLIAAYSFYPGKNLGAYGDAGAVTTNEKDLADTIRLLRNHGRTEKYTHIEIGYGNRMDTLQASILLAKLSHLADWNQRRRSIAAQYTAALKDIPHVTVPTEAPWATPVYHLYVIKIKDRDKLKQYLKDHGVETGIHYPIPLHLQPAYSYLGYKKGSLPHTEKAVEEILSLPIYPEMRADEVKYVAECIKDFYS